MRVCDIDQRTDDIATVSVIAGPGEELNEGTIWESAFAAVDLCGECRDAIETLGLVAGIVSRLPRRRRRTTPGEGDSR